MGRFHTWLSKKGYIFEDFESSQQGFDANPIAKFQFNDDPRDFADDHDSVLTQIMKLAMTKSPQDTINFFKELARDDEEMADLVDRIGDGRAGFKRASQEKPEVVPAIADQGRGEVEQGN
jgi:hypothetical protein